ncbi:MAG: hypothetical protein FWE28_02290 [Oscillospiraceae bacterium]|nr:hypothetical protein [Oscillospiraceae bacterium]
MARLAGMVTGSYSCSYSPDYRTGRRHHCRRPAHDGGDGGDNEYGDGTGDDSQRNNT